MGSILAGCDDESTKPSCACHPPVIPVTVISSVSLANLYIVAYVLIAFVAITYPLYHRKHVTVRLVVLVQIGCFVFIFLLL